MNFAAQLRAKKETIIQEWLRAVRAMPAASNLSRPQLRDHLPQLLDELADHLERETSADEHRMSAPQQHARERHAVGFDVRHVVFEFQALRRVLVQQLCDTNPRPPLPPILLMHELIDRAVMESVVHYATENDRVRETFVGVLGHDLRTPLGAIALQAQRLWQQHADCGDQTTIAIAARIARSTARMGRMIDDLLDFTRGRLGGGIIIERERIDMRAVITQVVEELALAHPDRSIHSVATRADLRGEWDGDRVTQALTNLAANAVQHGTDPIVIEAIEQGSEIAIDVRSGGELDPAVRPALFEPFRRGRSPYRQGLGLGLYIVSEIAKAHGGSVDVTSADGQTTFSLRLPREAPQNA